MPRAVGDDAGGMTSEILLTLVGAVLFVALIATMAVVPIALDLEAAADR